MPPTPSDGVPHQFPFRLVERLGGSVDGVVSIILVTANGALQPGLPWPPTLVAEALAQSVLLAEPPPSTAELRLVALDGVEVLRDVRAGDRLEVEVVRDGSFAGLHRYTCRALCGGALAAVARITVKG